MYQWGFTTIYFVLLSDGLLFYDNTYTFMFSEPLDSSNEMAINTPVKEEKQDFSFEADIKVFSI